MSEATHMASRIFSMLPLAIPFVGVLSPLIPRHDAEGERAHRPAKMHQQPLQEPCREGSSATGEATEE